MRVLSAGLVLREAGIQPFCCIQSASRVGQMASSWSSGASVWAMPCALSQHASTAPSFSMTMWL